MSQAIEPDLSEAQDALSRRDWTTAFALLKEADARGVLVPDTLPMLAEAAYLSGHPRVSQEAWERVYAARSQAGDTVAAAEAAVRVAELCVDANLVVPAQAWLRRAEGLLGDQDPVLSGFIDLLRSAALLTAGQGREAMTGAQRALEIAERHGNAELGALSQLNLGRALIVSGEMEEGLALLDEAVRSGASDDLDPRARSIIFCGAICSWQSLSEFDRADQWTTSMKMFCDEHDVGSYQGRCRVHRAQMLRLRGACTDAEAELHRAADELRAYSQGVEVGWVTAEIGGVRLRLGDLKGAEEAFLQAHELGWDPQPGMALLMLARGDVPGAAASIRHALEHPSDAPSFESPPHSELSRAPLLAAQSEIALAGGDVERARWAAAELSEVAATFGTIALRATAATARGAALSLEGDAAAGAAYQEGVRLWQSVQAPYEAARARMRLADVFGAEGARDRAVMELRAALATLERVGAVLDARRAAEALARLEPGDPNARSVKVFMFTDIVRSTDLIEAIGDEAWGHLVRWHNDTLSSVVAEHGGEVVQTTGDGFFLTFDAAEPALACAVAIQRALAAHRREHGFAPQVRIGLHRAEATRDGANWSGKGVHAAARIGALAEGEEILASRETAEAASTPRSEPRRVTLKGVSTSIEVVSVGWR